MGKKHSFIFVKKYLQHYLWAGITSGKSRTSQNSISGINFDCGEDYIYWRANGTYHSPVSDVIPEILASLLKSGFE